MHFGLILYFSGEENLCQNGPHMPISDIFREKKSQSHLARMARKLGKYTFDTYIWELSIMHSKGSFFYNAPLFFVVRPVYEPDFLVLLLHRE